MSVVVAVTVIVGAAIGSLLIPPRHRMGTQPTHLQSPAQPRVSAIPEETR